MKGRLIGASASVLLFFSALIFFLPKQPLYFAFERFLKTRQVVIAGERVRERPFSLSLEEGKIVAKGIEAAAFFDVTVRPWIVWNTLRVERLSIDRGFASWLPTSVESAALSYSPLHPYHIEVKARIGACVVTGRVDLRESTVRLRLLERAACEKTGRWVRPFRKNGEGVFEYVGRF